MSSYKGRYKTYKDEQDLCLLNLCTLESNGGKYTEQSRTNTIEKACPYLRKDKELPKTLPEKVCNVCAKMVRGEQNFNR